MARKVSTFWFVLVAMAAIAHAQPPAQRQAVPDDETLASALRFVGNLYKTDYNAAKTPTQRQALAKKLLDEGHKSKADQVSCYALLVAAERIATQSGDCDLLCEVMEAEAKYFDINVLRAKAAALDKAAPNVKLDLDLYFLTRKLEQLIRASIQAREWDAARKLLETAEATARRMSDTDLAKVYAAQATEVEVQQKSASRLEMTLAELDRSPASADANSAAGNLLCFELNDWPRGMSMLALGTDKDSQSCAEAELKASTPEAKLKVADGWSALAQSHTGVAQKHIQQHALAIYQQLQPTLNGLPRSRVDKEIGDLIAASMPDRMPLSMLKPLRYDVWGAERGPFMVGEVAGRKFPDSLWAHAPGDKRNSVVVFELPCEFKYLIGWCAYHTTVSPRTPVMFRANGTNREIFRLRDRLAKVDKLVPFRIDLRGQSRLELLVDCPGDYYEAWTIWVSPMLHK